MSIESDSEFFEIGNLSYKYRGSFDERVTSSFLKTDDVSDPASAFVSSPIIGQVSDPVSGPVSDFAPNQPYSSEFDLSENEFERDLDDEDFTEGRFPAEPPTIGVLPYDFEMEPVDTLNLVGQINAYTSEFWEFASVIGDCIVFKRPKYA